MKTCFVVSPIGEAGSEIRINADKLFKYKCIRVQHKRIKFATDKTKQPRPDTSMQPPRLLHEKTYSNRRPVGNALLDVENKVPLNASGMLYRCHDVGGHRPGFYDCQESVQETTKSAQCKTKEFLSAGFLRNNQPPTDLSPPAAALFSFTRYVPFFCAYCDTSANRPDTANPKSLSRSDMPGAAAAFPPIHTTPPPETPPARFVP